NIIDKAVPHLHRLTGTDQENHPTNSQQVNKIMLFVMAIAIHNFPEGIAAGVGFGTENVTEALTIALGIALQNIPEGMVIIGPMLAAGISPKRTLLFASLTGVVEIIGTLLGYFAASISVAVLPFALAFAGGTMIYVVSDEMIPETHSHGHERGATYALLFGFCLMLFIDHFLG
ncbi:MAG: ZIP family metal transporter, partial [Clostridia bacterium]|nr:ZIP family metal transporter [Clostridia bacterium]